MQIIGLTSRGLIKGARVTDRQTDRTDRRTDGEEHELEALFV